MLNKGDRVSKKQMSKKRDSWSKKTWYTIQAPDIFGNVIVGETPALKSDQLLGRVVELPLNEVTKSFKHFRYKIFLKITDVHENTAKTEYYGHELLRDQVSRVVRRRASRIDLVEDVTTKDERKMRIKLLLITKRRVQTTLKNDIRKMMRDRLLEFIKKRTLKEFVEKVLDGTLNKNIEEDVKKLYPISFIDVRKIEVLDI